MKIMKQFLVKVYEDYNILIEPLIVEEKEVQHKAQISPAECSSYTRQYIEVVERSILQAKKHESLGISEWRQIIQDSIKETAENEAQYNLENKPIAYSSVSDKITRKTDQKIDDFLQDLMDFYNSKGNSINLKNKVWKNSRTENDKQFIMTSFNKFKSILNN